MIPSNRPQHPNAIPVEVKNYIEAAEAYMSELEAENARLAVRVNELICMTASSH